MSELQPCEAAEQRKVIGSWEAMIGGGRLQTLPERPDDPVAHKLLDAAGDAIGRGDLRQGVQILKLVTREFGRTQEAAFARTVLDRIHQARCR